MTLLGEPGLESEPRNSNKNIYLEQQQINLKARVTKETHWIDAEKASAYNGKEKNKTKIHGISTQQEISETSVSSSFDKINQLIDLGCVLKLSIR